MDKNLEKLFNPKSIAVVGVSEDKTKLGSVIYSKIMEAGFAGDIIPVNPKYDELDGRKVYDKVSDIEVEVDMAVIVIPAQFVLETVRTCADKQVKYVVIISAGFGEASEAGKQLEEDVVAVAKSADMRILGPNCLGLSVPGTNLDASFAATMPKGGNIAFLSQSGAFNTAILDLATTQGLGFSHFVSLGNKSDLNELDFLEVWLNDPQVEVIGIYIEEFSDGKDLIEMIKAANKPVVLLHPGESEEAQSAIASHTGSLAGATEVIRAALRKAGVIQVDSIEKMFNTLKGFSWSKAVEGDKVALITNAGGPGIMMTDMVVRNGIAVPQLSEELQLRLKESLPDASSTHNPIDLIGDALADRYQDTIRELDNTDEIDSILVLLTPQHVTQIEETAEAIIDYHNNGSKPIIAVFLGEERVDVGLKLLNDAQVPAYQFAEEGVFVLGAIRKFQKYSASRQGEKPDTILREDTLAGVAPPEAKPLAQEQLYSIISGLEINMPAEATIETFQQAVNFVSEHDFPVVMKASTEDIVHKTDVDALELNIDSMDKLQDSFDRLRSTISKATGNQEPKLLIQEQVVGGEELIIGVNRDGDSNVYEPHGIGFGHLLLVGKGGIYTEVYEDTAMALVPVTRQQLLDMVLSTKVSKVLMGTRGEEPLAIESLIDTLAAIQTMVRRFPEIVSLDINPLILTPDKAIAVDMKVFVKQ